MQHLERLVNDHQGDDEFTKSRLGLTELDRYDDALTAIEEETPLRESCKIAPILSIYRKYDTGDIDADMAKQMLREARRTADAYLKSHGFDGDKYITLGGDVPRQADDVLKKTE